MTSREVELTVAAGVEVSVVSLKIKREKKKKKTDRSGKPKKEESRK